MSKIHNAIKAVEDGVVTDAQIKEVLKLRDSHMLLVDGQKYTLRELAPILERAKYYAETRWGREWSLRDQGIKCADDCERNGKVIVHTNECPYAYV